MKPTRDEIKSSIGHTLPLLGNDVNDFTKWCAVFRLAAPYLGEDDATKLANEFQDDGFTYSVKL